ncbi:MAG: hypothetical protein HY611_05465 [Elusimicrobia bacterium]|nr:hypothetical protein [Elusimicrobiota bacterium]
MLLEVFIFGTAGLGLEVMFTALTDWPRLKDKLLPGYSSLWYFPLYASAPLFFNFAGPTLFPWPVWARGAAYTAGCWLIEYCGMGVLRLCLGQSPSEKNYYRSRWNVRGLTRLDFAPAYFALGLIFECIFRRLHS